MAKWVGAQPRYCYDDDSIELVAPDGEVMARLHRSSIIRMVGMLPPNPPQQSRSVKAYDGHAARETE